MKLPEIQVTRAAQPPMEMQTALFHFGWQWETAARWFLLDFVSRKRKVTRGFAGNWACGPGDTQKKVSTAGLPKEQKEPTGRFQVSFDTAVGLTHITIHWCQQQYRNAISCQRAWKVGCDMLVQVDEKQIMATVMGGFCWPCTGLSRFRLRVFSCTNGVM
jgi:hypothetical protein